MGKRLRKTLIIFLSFVLIGSFGMYIRQLMIYRQGQAIYEQAAQMVPRWQNRRPAPPGRPPLL